MAFVFWVAICVLLLPFANGLRISTQRSYVLLAFILIMLAHYCLPNVAAQYYIYDMPAILFYMVTFLLLTSNNRFNLTLGGLLTILFTMNREPIAIALFHAAAWWLVRDHELPTVSRASLTSYAKRVLSRDFSDDHRRFAIGCIVLTFVGTLALRQLLMYIFTGYLFNADEGMLYEDGHIRVLANIKRIATEAAFFQQFIATGFGLVFFLPIVFARLSLTTRAVVVASILPLAPLIFVGNFFTELRIYNEYVPLMACVLAVLLSLIDEKRTIRLQSIESIEPATSAPSTHLADS